MTEARLAAAPSRAPASAAAVANAFLELGWGEESQVPPITPMKLQKLLFYAHGWYLGNSGDPLFDEDFEAWTWGPVVRDVYLETMKFGKDPVAKKVSALQKVGSDPLDFKLIHPELEDKAIAKYVSNVWDVYKSYSGVQLSNSTHAAGEPWTIVREQYGNLDSKPKIPNELIYAVFKKKVEDAAARHSPADKR